MVRKILAPNEGDHQNLNIGNLMDENKLKKMFSTAWDKAWSAFTDFGLLMSTIMGLIFISKIIKFLIDTLIHAYSLHEIFGFSWRLFGCFYDVITYYFLRDHQGNQGNNQRQTTNNIYPDLENAQFHVPQANQHAITHQKIPQQIESTSLNNSTTKASAPTDTLKIVTETKNESFAHYNVV